MPPSDFVTTREGAREPARIKRMKQEQVDLDPGTITGEGNQEFDGIKRIKEVWFAGSHSDMYVLQVF
jgi:hypothetical protein